MISNLLRPHPRFAQSSEYRADIDGLRAVAVISVILFHLQIPGFGGGYVGVDMFFVISGFLITQHIRREMQAEAFSFARFYERRMRRLAPSLLVTLMFACVGAALMFSPTDLVGFAESMVASTFFAANIFFYVRSGYFTADVDDKPLLHMWSLGAEEQFYLLWPLLLLLILRHIPLARGWMVVTLLGVLSLLAAVILGGRDANAAFYLIPTRLFEFFMGAGLVWLPMATLRNKSLSDGCLLLGIAMVVVSVTCYTKQTPFPSYYALLPCLGASLMIMGGRDTHLRVLIGNQGIAYLGRISYELYLFHWPMIVFYKYLAFEALHPTDVAMILAATVALAMATYHGVGCPLRYGYARDLQQRQNFFIGCLVVSFILLAMALSMKISRGWVWRLPEQARLLLGNPGEFHKTQYGGVGFKENELLILGEATASPQFILIGDSFAGQYAAGLSEFLSVHHQAAYLLYVNGCLIAPQTIVYTRTDLDKKCAATFQRVQDVIKDNKLPVIQAQSWSSYKDQVMRRTGELVSFSKENNNDYYAFMIETIEQMRVALDGHRFAFVGISPGISEQKTIARCFQIPAYLPNKCAASVGAKEETRLNGQEFNLAAAKYALEHPEVAFINPRTALCHDGMCYAIDDATSFYSDYSHFTKHGALHVIKHYQDLLLSLHP